MNDAPTYGCRVRNLTPEALSGFRREKEALSAGGHYLTTDGSDWLDAAGRQGLCVVCENCGSVVEEVTGNDELECPDCGNLTFRVLQTFRLITIGEGFSINWRVPGETISIRTPRRALEGRIGVHYTVDGSDPTLSSPIYKGPIAYQESFLPIRAAVFYADARSEIIEWDFGRAEQNRTRIRKASNGEIEPQPAPKPRRPKSPRVKPARPESSRDIPPSSVEPVEVKPSEEKGGATLISIVMAIGGCILIRNDWTVTGWILAIFGCLAILGQFIGDNEG